MEDLLGYAQHTLAIILFGMGIMVNRYGPDLLGLSKNKTSLIVVCLFLSAIAVEIVINSLINRTEKKRRLNEKRTLLGLLKSDLDVYEKQIAQNYEIRSHKASLPDVIREFPSCISINLHKLRDCIDDYNNVHKGQTKDEKEKREILKVNIRKCIRALAYESGHHSGDIGMALTEIEDIKKMIRKQETDSPTHEKT